MSSPETSRQLPPEAKKEGSAVSLDQFMDRLKENSTIAEALQQDAQAESHLRGLIKEKLDQGQTASETMEEVSALLPKLLNLEAKPEEVGVQPEAPESSGITPQMFMERLKTKPDLKAALDADPQAASLIMDAVQARLDEGKSASQTMQEVSELMPKILKIEPVPEALGVQPEEEPGASEISPKAFMERLKSFPDIKKALDDDPQAASLIMDAAKARLDEGKTVMQTYEEVSGLLPRLLNVEAPGELPPGETYEVEPIDISEAVEVVKPEGVETPAPAASVETAPEPEKEVEILMPNLAELNPNNQADLEKVANEYLSEGLEDYPEAYKYLRELGSQLGKGRGEIFSHVTEDMQGLIRNHLEALKRRQETVADADKSIRKLVDRKLSQISKRQAA